MNKNYDDELVKNIVTQYFSGKAVTLLSAEHSIPRSTIYTWIKKHRKLKASNNVEISYQDYHNLKRRFDKLEEKLTIIKMADCSTSSPLQEKLSALEKLYGQFRACSD